MDENSPGTPPPDPHGSAKKKDEPGPELKSPAEWARITGNGPKPTPGVVWFGEALAGMSRQMGSPAHEIASMLHGWKDHEHHANEPMLLTREDYEAALKEAFPQDEHELETEGDRKGQPKLDVYGNPVIKRHGGAPKPHKPALSEHKGGRMRVRLVKGKHVKEVEKS